MNQLFIFFKTVSLLVLSLFSSFVAIAQNDTSSLEIDILTVEDNPFYTKNWFWIVLGLLFLFLLIALIRGGGKRKTKNDTIKSPQN